MQATTYGLTPFIFDPFYLLEKRMRKRSGARIQVWSQAIPAAGVCDFVRWACEAGLPAIAWATAGAAKGAVSRRNQMGRGAALL